MERGILQETIDKFDNGMERYNMDPLVHQCVNTLASGGDPIKLIDSLIGIINDKQTALKEIFTAIDKQKIVYINKIG